MPAQTVSKSFRKKLKTNLRRLSKTKQDKQGFLQQEYKKWIENKLDIDVAKIQNNVMKLIGTSSTTREVKQNRFKKQIQNLERCIATVEQSTRQDLARLQAKLEEIRRKYPGREPLAERIVEWAYSIMLTGSLETHLSIILQGPPGTGKKQLSLFWWQKF